MVSETDPYAWATAAALFSGLAAGQAIRCLFPSRASLARTRRAGSRRVARVLILLSLGILALAGLLVLSDKAALAQSMGNAALGAGDGGGVVAGRGALLPWAAFVAVAALASGLLPLAAGLPAAAVCLAVLCFLRLALAGWLPLSPAPTDRDHKIAYFLPYEVGPSLSRGHFEMPGRDSIPVVRELSLRSDAMALSAESLDLAGPLAFLASLAASPEAEGPGTLRLYRVVGVSAPGGFSEAFPAPDYAILLDEFLSLPSGAGLAPGAAPVSRSTAFGLARRSRATSAAAGLIALEPVIFGLLSEPFGISIE